MNILVLGATGLIGNQVFKHLSKKNKVYGTYNNKKKIKKITFNKDRLIYFNALYKTSLGKILIKSNPKVVINCIGVTKHIKETNKKNIYRINGEFPHYAKEKSNIKSAKFIQISTDCVFDGRHGNYTENSEPNAKDFYGKSKAQGEINDNVNLTLRTSTIGHELFTKYGLLEWFLDQNSSCEGYSKAIFNGLKTINFAKILENLIKKKITGLINVSGIQINKYELLKKIKKIYKKKIIIKKNNTFKINRTLNNKLLRKLLPNIKKKNWNKLIRQMKNENAKSFSKN